MAYSATLTRPAAPRRPIPTRWRPGAIPPGFTLNPASRVLVRHAAAPGEWAFTVRARDANYVAGYQPYTLTVGGPAPTRIIGLSGDLAFGSVTVGTTATRTLTIANTGNSALTVTGIAYPTGFSGAWCGTIAAGGSQAVAVTFAPQVAVTYSGPVTVSADHTSGTNTMAVSGTGRAPLAFTDDPLQPRGTVVKAAHLSELRAAVDTLRIRYALPPVAWTDPTLVPRVTVIKAVHLNELRAAVSGVYGAAGLPPPEWAAEVAVPGSTVISAAQIAELRTAVAALW